MKKILALLLAVLLCVTVFVACGPDDEPTTTEPGYTPAFPDDTTLDSVMPDFGA